MGSQVGMCVVAYVNPHRWAVMCDSTHDSEGGHLMMSEDHI